MFPSSSGGIRTNVEANIIPHANEGVNVETNMRHHEAHDEAQVALCTLDRAERVFGSVHESSHHHDRNALSDPTLEVLAGLEELGAQNQRGITRTAHGSAPREVMSRLTCRVRVTKKTNLMSM